jgi:hypothetical protein
VSHKIEGSELVSKRVTKNSFRREIINAWDGHCAYCGNKPEKITLDHIIPKVKGGMTVRANLVPACASCNVSKNHCDVWAWYETQTFYNLVKQDAIKAWLNA